jgi:serine/threonine-protein kinase
VLSLALVIAGAPPTASADTSPTDKATAEALFNEGKRLMDAGDYEHACARFADSEQLDPGVGTLLNLGVCYERAGRTASAWATYKEAARAAADAGERPREKFARDHAAAIEPKLAKLTVVVPSGSAVDGLQVTRDREQVPAGSWGLPIPVDPGEHAIVASAPAHKAATLKVMVTAAGSQTVTVPVLENESDQGQRPPSTAGTPAPAAGAALTTTSTPTQSADVTPTSGGGLGAHRVLAIVAGGIGLAAAGVGTAFGLIAMSQKNDARSVCPGTCASQADADRWKSAETSGNISTIAFIVGGVGVAGSALLWFTAPTNATAKVGLGPGGIHVRGSW